eukprot:gene6827-6901_t
MNHAEPLVRFSGVQKTYDGEQLVVRSGTAWALQLPDGQRLPGLNVNHLAPGAPAEACIRPERIALHAASATPQAPALRATVARAIYYGDHLRLMCDIGAGQAQATVKLPLTRADANPHPEPGDAVLLEFPTESVRIYAPPTVH